MTVQRYGGFFDYASVYVKLCALTAVLLMHIKERALSETFSFCYIEKRRVSRGMVSMERMVVTSVTSVMSVVSRLYFRQRMVP